MTTDSTLEFGLYQGKDGAQVSLSEMSMDFIVPLNLLTEWRRCGLVADFLANYQSFHYKNPKKALSVLSYVTNELLENAVKFSSDLNKLVNLSLRQYDDEIGIETINACSRHQAENLNDFVETLDRADDIDALYLERLERAATADDDVSQMGLLTIAKDYGAKIGIKINPKGDDQHCDVFVKVLLKNKVIESL